MPTSTTTPIALSVALPSLDARTADRFDDEDDEDGVALERDAAAAAFSAAAASFASRRAASARAAASAFAARAASAFAARSTSRAALSAFTNDSSARINASLSSFVASLFDPLARNSSAARRRAVATSRALDATSFSNNTALDFFRSVSYGFGPHPESPFAFLFPTSRRAAFPRVVARLRSRAVVVFFPPPRAAASHSPVIIPSVARAASYRDRADPAVARAASSTSDASSSRVARAVGIARDDSRFESKSIRNRNQIASTS